MLVACSEDGNDSKPSIQEPTAYVFERDGSSTVSFSGQTTRIAMAEEIISEFMNPAITESSLQAMFNHQEGIENFNDATLNASNKNVRSKTAASQDFFSSNTVDATAIKTEFEGWITDQVSWIFPSWNNDAAYGIPGAIQEAGGGPIRYVNSQGLELNQAFNKSLIGALMVDQVLNNYLSPSVLDAGENRANNDAGITEDGKSYTTMEHKWDEAYGYVYGTSANTADPNLTIGLDDNFLNKYIGRVEGDPDFEGIADKIFNAFKLGRAAIVAGSYDTRDEQAAIIREAISEIIGIRAVYYLQQGKAGLEVANPDMASVFHDLSEGYGFIYSLQFTRVPNANGPYFSRVEVLGLLDELMGDGDYGFWDVTPATLQAISAEIASQFGFTVEEAGS